MTRIQRDQRMKSAKKLLKRFGMKSTRSYFKWKHLINTNGSVGVRVRIHLVQKT